MDWGEGLSLPLSAVNALRREVLAKPGPGPHGAPCPGNPALARPKARKGPGEPPAFTLSFRRWEQLSPASLDQGPALVYLPVQEWAAHEKEAAELTGPIRTSPSGGGVPPVAFDRERPQLRQALEAACRAGPPGLLGTSASWPWPGSSALTPGGTSAWASPTPLTGGGTGPAGGLPRPRPPSSA